MRFIALLLLAANLCGCAADPPPCPSAPIPWNNVVYLVQHGWHTDIAVPSQELRGNITGGDFGNAEQPILGVPADVSTRHPPVVSWSVFPVSPWAPRSFYQGIIRCLSGIFPGACFFSCLGTGARGRRLRGRRALRSGISLVQNGSMTERREVDQRFLLFRRAFRRLVFVSPIYIIKENISNMESTASICSTQIGID